MLHHRNVMLFGTMGSNPNSETLYFSNHSRYLTRRRSWVLEREILWVKIVVRLCFTLFWGAGVLHSKEVSLLLLFKRSRQKQWCMTPSMAKMEAASHAEKVQESDSWRMKVHKAAAAQFHTT